MNFRAYLKGWDKKKRERRAAAGEQKEKKSKERNEDLLTFFAFPMRASFGGRAASARPEPAGRIPRRGPVSPAVFSGSARGTTASELRKARARSNAGGDGGAAGEGGERAAAAPPPPSPPPRRAVDLLIVDATKRWRRTRRKSDDRGKPEEEGGAMSSSASSASASVAGATAGALRWLAASAGWPRARVALFDPSAKSQQGSSSSSGRRGEDPRHLLLPLPLPLLPPRLLWDRRPPSPRRRPSRASCPWRPGRASRRTTRWPSCWGASSEGKEKEEEGGWWKKKKRPCLPLPLPLLPLLPRPSASPSRAGTRGGGPPLLLRFRLPPRLRLPPFCSRFPRGGQRSRDRRRS